MCGICGYISKNRISEETLTDMNNTMVHRGPDDSGVMVFDGDAGYSVGLAQRRLSILDLSPLGHQPMAAADGRILVVFNGEIYNFLELKREFSDYPFKSTTDTEVILAAYLKYGKDFVRHIHGMFAIALFDRQTNELFLARDRIGKKPLYYNLEDGNIVFASELKAIMKNPGFKKNIRRSIIPRFLYQQYINAPETIFENVWQLEPGHILRFCRGQISDESFWSVKSAYRENCPDASISYHEAKEELKKRLKKAVADRMIADVPLGTFLSGGYDSSLITALAQENSESPVKTFSIGFNVPKYNEAEYAKSVARHLGTDHTELYIDEKQMFDLVESIPDYYDEPFADESQIPTMLVCELAKSRVTVALSGDGGDEFFCGYNIYKNVKQAQMLEIPGAAAFGICSAPYIGNYIYEHLPFKVKVIAGNRDPETKTQLVSDRYIRAANAFLTGLEKPDKKMSYLEYVNKSYVEDGFFPCRYPVESSYDVKDYQVRRMLLDMDTYLPGDILVKMDRASMKYSLECRCPIMDTAVMEYSFRIPQKYKYMNGDKKHILKDIAWDYIPRELLDRPKKGFGVPMDMWLHGPLKEKLLDYSEKTYLKNQNVFDADYVSKFIRSYLRQGDVGAGSGANFSRIAFSFFNFQQWYERYMRI